MNTSFFWAVLLIVGAVGAVGVTFVICPVLGLLFALALYVIIWGEPEPKQDNKTR